MSMVPKGGDSIWGGVDWSPEEICSPTSRKQRNNDTQANGDQTGNTKRVNYGRIVSFGKDVAEAPSSEIEMIDFRTEIVELGQLSSTMPLIVTDCVVMVFFTSKTSPSSDCKVKSLTLSSMVSPEEEAAAEFDDEEAVAVDIVD
ncbi:hypothetical protein Q3G72_033264 [Acer saccharum]|nr:hypothetical protein Q3G72_033264 [Acer saccharum]